MLGLADLFTEVVGADPRLRVVAYDGSSVGAPDAEVTVRVRTPVALSYLAGAPGDLGLARAFVTGHLDVAGDLYTGLLVMLARDVRDLDWAQRLRLAKVLVPAMVPRPPVPALEAPPPWRRGRRHSRSRDAAAIAHHYDVSNTFYEILLGPSMAYTCACYPDADASLEVAQEAKFDLVARKLGLREGMRLLDVGCGWGGMVLHAARHYGVRALGVTLSRQQAEWAQKAIAEAGLSELAEVRHADYRDVTDTGFDAVSSIGLTEHIGQAQLGDYFAFLASRLRPQGRLLNHCITRNDGTHRARAGGFIDRYIFPDGELVGPGQIIGPMNDAGFEIRHEESLREHYAMTLRDWGANLEGGWDAAVAEVGLARARVWRLYLAASRVAFTTNRIQLHQVLGVVPGPQGESGFPLRPRY